MVLENEIAVPYFPKADFYLPRNPVVPRALELEEFVVVVVHDVEGETGHGLVAAEAEEDAGAICGGGQPLQKKKR